MGIKQGDSLSLYLFYIIMNEIIKKVKQKGGYRVGNKELKIICYADNAIIVAEDEDDLQRLLYKFYVTPLEYNVIFY